MMKVNASLQSKLSKPETDTQATDCNHEEIQSNRGKNQIFESKKGPDVNSNKTHPALPIELDKKEERLKNGGGVEPPM